MEKTIRLEEAILKTLAYFDYFKYPLNKEELHRFLEIEAEQKSVDAALVEMEISGAVSRDNELYALGGKTQIFERRRISNDLALALLPKAKSVGNFLYNFPFVRFVGISGSLSKLYADEHTDFDYFIVTAPNRLWIARSLMHAFKKLSFLFNRQKYYCMNYYIDSDHLCIEDFNRYTAIELATLIPVVNDTLYHDLIEENTWLGSYVPNFIPFQKASIGWKMRPFKKMIEFLFNLLLPKQLNSILMRLTDMKWQRKWKAAGYPMEDYELAFRTRTYVSKNHPKNYQKRVLKEVKHQSIQLAKLR